ncbi:MAG: carboxypeptidase regulatory-like domain-containing protein, partial [Bacteroidales bacterium]
PTTWWNKEADDKVDFSRPEDFYRIGVVLWNASPLCIPMGADWNPDGCPENEAKFFPMRARVTVLAYPSSSTPTYTANFKVTDGSNNVSNANIWINNQNITTNTSGEASINLINGSYSYTVTKSGYIQKSGTVNISGGNVTENVTLTPAYLVTFNVTDEDAAAVEGANVLINGKNLQTNSEGKATISLPNGDYNYEVTKDGFPTKSDNITVSGQAITENVTLSIPYYDVFFLVKDGSDNPIEGASVAINGFDIQLTGANGFATHTLPDGTYNYTVSSDGFDDASGSVTVSGANTDRLVILSESSYTISFNVKDQGSNNLEGASISIDGNNLTTDADGNASIDLLNGDYPYSVTKDGYVEATGSVTVAGAPIIENVILEEVTWTVTFAVKDESSTALEGATVSIGDSDELTDSNGEAIFSLINGDYSYEVTLSQYGAETGSITVNGSALTENVTLTQTTYLLSFSVSDEDSNPVEGADIAINGTTLTTDVAGETSIEVVNGNYPYTVSKTGYNDESATAVVSGAAITETVSLSLETFAVNFTVLDGNSNPVENALVSIDGNDLNTDSNGQVSISLINGDYNYSVSKEGFEQSSGSLTLSGADVNEEVTLTAQTFVVTFQVADESSNALEGANISINDQNLSSDSNGEATIELANGDYDYSVSLSGYNEVNGSVTVAGSGLTENVTLVAGSYTLTFTVNDGEANAVDGATISINESELTSDASGEATIALSDGEYNYTVTKDNYEDASGSVTISGADLTENITLEIINSTLSINAGDISVYPNPGSEIINIKSTISFKAKTRFEVYSVSGVMVYSKVNEYEIDQLSLDLSNVEEGVYFLKIKSEGPVLTKRIVIR